MNESAKKINAVLQADPTSYDKLSVATVMAMKKELGIPMSPDAENGVEEEEVVSERVKEKATIEFLKESYESLVKQEFIEKTPVISKVLEDAIILYINMGDLAQANAVLSYYLAGEQLTIYQEKHKASKKTDKGTWEALIKSKFAISVSKGSSLLRLYEAYQPYRRFLIVKSASKELLVAQSKNVIRILERGDFDGNAYDFDAEPYLNKAFWALSGKEWTDLLYGRRIPTMEQVKKQSAKEKTEIEALANSMQSTSIRKE